MNWLRRNRLALLALLVLLPVTAWVMSSNAWSGYLAHQPTRPVPIAGGAVNYAGAIIGPAQPTELDARAHGLPEGTRLVRIVLPVRPVAGDRATCHAPELWDRGGERRWAELSDTIGAEPLDRLTACTPDESPYELVLDYVVPDDARELSLAVLSPSELPAFAEIPISSS
ncbi:hypothetical protein ACF07D_12450 [Leucobacter sp. NPDC015123]|uniref:hypothetical protein n=1 Tax=Leucobacter sp. NPDC015123 TaxID=3364129 RepID=UPI0036F4855E